MHVIRVHTQVHTLAWCPWRGGGAGGLGVLAVGSSGGHVDLLSVPLPSKSGAKGKKGGGHDQLLAGKLLARIAMGPSGYCACLAWSPITTPPTAAAQGLPGAVTACNDRSPGAVAGLLAAAGTSGHTVVVPFALDADGVSGHVDHDSVVYVGAADACAVTSAAWASATTLVTGGIDGRVLQCVCVYVCVCVRVCVYVGCFGPAAVLTPCGSADGW